MKLELDHRQQLLAKVVPLHSHTTQEEWNLQEKYYDHATGKEGGARKGGREGGLE